MSYRCEVCNKPCRAGQPKLKFTVKRTNGQIEKEVAVCKGCHEELQLGVPLGEVRAKKVKLETPVALVGHKPVRMGKVLY